MSINLEVQWARLAKPDSYKDILKEDGDDDARKDNLSQIMHLQGFCKAIILAKSDIYKDIARGDVDDEDGQG